LIEAIEKKNVMYDHSNNVAFEWHFIGAIQKNKTKKIAENFDWVHSVDRFEVAQRLSDQRPSNLNPLKIFLQVNVDNEKNKNGIIMEKAKNLAILTSKLPKLYLCGLMAIPMSSELFTNQKKAFSKLKTLRNVINESGELTHKLKSLSMGMSGDLEAAISETDSNTETWLRIGTDLFGERS
jgi:pyridoxal phosphate enzyme (YggS family)